MQSEVIARLGGAPNRLPRWLALLFPCSIAGSLFGQGVLAPPPGFQGAPAVPPMGNVSPTVGQPNAQANGQAYGTANTPPASQANGQNNGQTPAEGDSADQSKTAAVAPVESLMAWGALHLRARASYQFLYDTGVLTQPGKSQGTYSQTFTPGLTIAVGPHVSLDYSPSFRFFSASDLHNTVDQFESLTAGIGLEDWSFSAGQTFTLTDEPLVETGGQTEEKNLDLNLGAAYRFNDKLSFNTGLGIGLSYVNGTNTFATGTNSAPSQLGNSQSYSVSESIDYQLDPKFTAGFLLSGSYSKQDGGFNSISESYNVHVAWHPGEKLSLTASGGIQDVQIQIHGAPDLVTPVYGASASYLLFPQTTLSLSAGRTVGTSLFQNQITESTQVGLALQQRLLGLVQLSLGFGYSLSDYKSATQQLATSRSDSGTSLTAGVQIPFKQHFHASAFYEFTQNNSSSSGLGSSSSQVGASLTWAY